VVVQLPQWLESLVRSTHVPEQFDFPAGQAQVPDWHVMPPEQTFPHEPQLLAFELMLTQAVPHCVVVVPAQASPHVPAEQLADPVPDVGAAHALLHAPQLLVSVCVLTQVFELQSVAVPWQLQFLPELLQHAPLLQVEQLFEQAPQLPVSLWRFLQLPLQQENPDAQTFPHAPQLLLSPLVSMHEPLQSAPVVQTHAPPEQVLPAPHTTPHPPQLFESVEVLTHAPLQSCVPAAHTQLLPEQTWFAPHVFPQPPQLLELEVVSTQVPLHRVRPAPVHVHVPFVHVWPAPHAVLQAPQWVTSV
jgi:hypothetical protein